MLNILFGGLLAIIASLSAQFANSFLAARRTRRAAAGAIGGEITAICDISQRHGYIESLKEFRDAIQKQQVCERFTLKVVGDYLVVFNSHLTQLGELPPDVARDIVRFYTQVKSLIEDLAGDLPAPPTVEYAVIECNRLIDLLTDTQALGRDVVTRLSRIVQ